MNGRRPVAASYVKKLLIARGEAKILIEKMNWFSVDEYLKKSTKIVVTLGAVEQHAYLSLLTDSIIVRKIAEKATKKAEVLLAPPIHYGVSSWACAYPGTFSISAVTYMKMIRDILVSFINGGFKKIVFLNGHGGNSFISEMINDTLVSYSDVEVFLYEWYKLNRTRKLMESINREIGHANWAENFRFTRVCKIPIKKKKYLEMKTFFITPQKRKDLLNDGSIGGLSQISDSLMKSIFDTAVDEFCEILLGI